MSRVYYNEIDPRAVAWLRELMKAGVIDDGEIDTRSIVDVRADDLREFHQCHFFAGIGGWAYAFKLAGWGDRAAWTGSCPCQPWSMAGKSEGTDDPRHLWPSWFRLIRERRPATLFGEQVASRDGLYWLDLVYHDLEAAGYAVGTVDLPACSVGAPHKRSRLWIVADADAAGCVGIGSVGLRQRSEDADRDAFGDDPDGRRQQSDVADSDGGGQRAAGRAAGCAGQPEQRGEASGMGHAASARCAGREDAGTDRRNESEGGGRQQPQRAGRDGGLVNAASTRSQGGTERRIQRGEPTERGELVNAIGARLEGHAGHGRDRDQSGWFGADPARSTPETGPTRNGTVADAERNGGRPDFTLGRPQGGAAHGGASARPTDGFWADAEWIPCSDGKARPVEPGTFPLAHGIPARVGRLRGYGNAIVPEVASEVVTAYMQVKGWR